MANSEIRTEFPALQERRAYLDHAAYMATQQANDAISAGKPDIAVQQWSVNIRREMGELNYVLHYFELLEFRKEHEWRNWQTAVVVAVALLSLVLSSVAIAGGWRW